MIMHKAQYLSPMIPSYNLEGTAAFFKDLLNFQIEMSTPDYFVLSKNNLTIHLLRAGKDTGFDKFNCIYNYCMNFISSFMVKRRNR